MKTVLYHILIFRSSYSKSKWNISSPEQCCLLFKFTDLGILLKILSLICCMTFVHKLFFLTLAAIILTNATRTTTTAATTTTNCSPVYFTFSTWHLSRFNDSSAAINECKINWLIWKSKHLFNVLIIIILKSYSLFLQFLSYLFYLSYHVYWKNNRNRFLLIRCCCCWRTHRNYDNLKQSNEAFERGHTERQLVQKSIRTWMGLIA